MRFTKDHEWVRLDGVVATPFVATRYYRKPKA